MNKSLTKMFKQYGKFTKIAAAVAAVCLMAAGVSAQDIEGQYKGTATISANTTIRIEVAPPFLILEQELAFTGSMDDISVGITAGYNNDYILKTGSLDLAGIITPPVDMYEVMADEDGTLTKSKSHTAYISNVNLKTALEAELGEAVAKLLPASADMTVDMVLTNARVTGNDLSLELAVSATVPVLPEQDINVTIPFTITYTGSMDVEPGDEVPSECELYFGERKAACVAGYNAFGGTQDDFWYSPYDGSMSWGWENKEYGDIIVAMVDKGYTLIKEYDGDPWEGDNSVSSIYVSYGGGGVYRIDGINRDRYVAKTAIFKDNSVAADFCKYYNGDYNTCVNIQNFFENGYHYFIYNDDGGISWVWYDDNFDALKEFLTTEKGLVIIDGMGDYEIPENQTIVSTMVDHEGGRYWLQSMNPRYDIVKRVVLSGGQPVVRETITDTITTTLSFDELSPRVFEGESRGYAYKLSLSETSTISVSDIGSALIKSASSNYVVELYDASWEKITTVEGILENLAAGTYYLLISDGGTTIDFTIDIAIGATCASGSCFATQKTVSVIGGTVSGGTSKNAGTSAKFLAGETVTVYYRQPGYAVTSVSWEANDTSVVFMPGPDPATATFTMPDNDVIIKVEEANVVSTLVSDRDIPTVTTEDIAILVPAAPVPFEMVVGPNPVSKAAESVNFFAKGGSVSDGSLRVYDATGKFVRKLRVNSGSGSGVVGSWDLRDAKGRPVAEGTYLVRGVVTTVSGKREKVSVLVGVR